MLVGLGRINLSSHFGEHWMLDGYAADSTLLGDKDFIYKFLDELPTLIGMKKITQPSVVEVKGNGQKDLGGVSGFVLIQESHISLHTFPQAGFISADVYTCQNDLNKIYLENYFRKFFLIGETEINFVIRGKKYNPLRSC